jgi:hypothetical protein
VSGEGTTRAARPVAARQAHRGPRVIPGPAAASGPCLCHCMLFTYQYAYATSLPDVTFTRSSKSPM